MKIRSRIFLITCWRFCRNLTCGSSSNPAALTWHVWLWAMGRLKRQRHLIRKLDAKRNGTRGQDQLQKQRAIKASCQTQSQLSSSKPSSSGCQTSTKQARASRCKQLKPKAASHHCRADFLDWPGLLLHCLKLRTCPNRRLPDCCILMLAPSGMSH